MLYQINTRQFTPEGTFAAAEAELPRLKELGVDILWLMPIHPIGVENRKGTLGSPYSVQDYYAVNPEFGTEEDLRSFVDAAHEQGFHVILDLVANHTAWDNAMATEHPDWYETTWDGQFRPTPFWDWSDIIDLDWSQPGVREHVGGAMEYWVREVGIDGYRADVAGYVPIDFWETMRARLDAIRPVFMLGEVQQTVHHRAAFDATYGWDWHVASKRIAQGGADATGFFGYYAEHQSLWPAEAMRLTYIENHDSNAWEGTIYENYGPALEAMTALSFTHEGLSMVHNGQEACNADAAGILRERCHRLEPGRGLRLWRTAGRPDRFPHRQPGAAQWPLGRADEPGDEQQAAAIVRLRARAGWQPGAGTVQPFGPAGDGDSGGRAGGGELCRVPVGRGGDDCRRRYGFAPGMGLPAPVQHR